jgi:hypothetical protein
MIDEQQFDDIKSQVLAEVARQAWRDLLAYAKCDIDVYRALILLLVSSLARRHPLILGSIVEALIVAYHGYLRCFESLHKLRSVHHSPSALEDLKLPLSESNQMVCENGLYAPVALSTPEHVRATMLNSSQSPKSHRDHVDVRLKILRLVVALALTLLGQDTSAWLCSSLAWKLVIGAFCNARLSLLIEKLSKTKVDSYEAVIEFDEFDEDAPPPSVVVKTDPVAVVRRTVCLLGGRMPQCLAWSRPMTTRLANSSVLAFLDRAGPIAEPFVFPNEIDYVSESDIIRYPASVPLLEKPLRLHFDEPLPAEVRAFLAHLAAHFDPAGAHPPYPHLMTHSVDECPCLLARLLDKSLYPISLQSSAKQGNVYMFESTSTVNGESFRNAYCLAPLRDILNDIKACWDDQSIRRMEEDTRKDLAQFDIFLTQHDATCHAFAFIPLHADESIGELSSDRLPWILVALVSLVSTPKEEMAELAQDLASAGIRFVYFSTAPEKAAKAFADRLEMATDWNSCIILSDAERGSATDEFDTPHLGYSTLSDIKARLPHGIHSIRQHLRDVDDIPLHVSMFAECSTYSKREMLDIYRENGESPVVVFSLLNAESPSMAGVASLCIGMESSAMPVGNPLAALSCSFVLPFEASPYVLTDIVKEARLLNRFRANFATELVIYTSCLCCHNGFLCLPCGLVVVALIVHGNWIRDDPNLLKEMPTKNDAPLVTREDLKDMSLMYLAPVVGVLLLQGPMQMSALLLIHLNLVHHHGQLAHVSSVALLPALVFEASLWFYVKLLLLTCLAIASVRHGMDNLKRRWERNQKREKLLFNTKLGMHSPV